MQEKINLIDSLIEENVAFENICNATHIEKFKFGVDDRFYEITYKGNSTGKIMDKLIKSVDVLVLLKSIAEKEIKNNLEVISELEK